MAIFGFIWLYLFLFTPLDSGPPGGRLIVTANVPIGFLKTYHPCPNAGLNPQHKMLRLVGAPAATEPRRTANSTFYSVFNFILCLSVAQYGFGAYGIFTRAVGEWPHECKHCKNE